MRIDKVLNVEVMRQRARSRLPRFVFDYVEGGAEDEITLRRNREVLEDLCFQPKALRGVAERSSRAALLGVDASLPAAVGPTGLAGLCWSNGDLELARASATFGVPFVLSTASMSPIEEVAKQVPNARLWFQVYLFKNRAVSDAMIQRARDANYEALVVTVDVPVPAKRERDWHNGFKQPLAITWSAKLDMLFHPRWFLSVVPNRPSFVNVQRELGADLQADTFLPTQFDPNITWDDIAKLRESWPRKLIVKGILRAEDAARAAALGVDVVALSNHGGRQLDGTPSAFEVLRDAVAAVRGKAGVFVDGGIRRGADIAKALALGANGVLLGRAPLYGLAVAGEAGVVQVLRILGEELDRVQALLGCRTLKDLSVDCLFNPPAMETAKKGA